MADQFNVQAGDYNGAVEEIGRTESETPAERSAMISIGDVLGSTISIAPMPYDTAAGIIGAVEGGYTYVPPQVKPSAAIKPTGAPITPRRAPMAPVSPETVEAAKEIKSMVGGAGREYEEKVRKEAGKVKKGTLVLPTLSVQDQISELEKISMGMDEKVFNTDMKKIIVDEVGGLSGVVKGENLQNMDVFQRNLVSVRDQRLDEVMGKLGVK